MQAVEKPAQVTHLFGRQGLFDPGQTRIGKA